MWSADHTHVCLPTAIITCAEMYWHLCITTCVIVWLVSCDWRPVVVGMWPVAIAMLLLGGGVWTKFGWSGERAPGFAHRMDNDLIPWKPTVVRITDLIGEAIDQSSHWRTRDTRGDRSWAAWAERQPSPKQPTVPPPP